jgi:hypothetical protein
MSPGRALFAGDRSTFRGSRSHWRKRSESTDLIPVVSEKRVVDLDASTAVETAIGHAASPAASR